MRTTPIDPSKFFFDSLTLKVIWNSDITRMFLFFHFIILTNAWESFIMCYNLLYANSEVINWQNVLHNGQVLCMSKMCFYVAMGNCEEQLTSTDCRSTVGQQITDRLPTDYRQLSNRLPTVGHLSVNSRPTVGNGKLFFTITFM